MAEAVILVTIAQQNNPRSDMLDVGIWLVVLGAILMLGTAVVFWIRKRTMSRQDQVSSEDAPFTLAEIRRMHRTGQISDDEYNRARSALIAQYGLAVTPPTTPGQTAADPTTFPADPTTPGQTPADPTTFPADPTTPGQTPADPSTFPAAPETETDADAEADRNAGSDAGPARDLEVDGPMKKPSDDDWPDSAESEDDADQPR